MNWFVVGKYSYIESNLTFIDIFQITAIIDIQITPPLNISELLVTSPQIRIEYNDVICYNMFNKYFSLLKLSKSNLI